MGLLSECETWDESLHRWAISRCGLPHSAPEPCPQITFCNESFTGIPGTAPLELLPTMALDPLHDGPGLQAEVQDRLHLLSHVLKQMRLLHGQDQSSPDPMAGYNYSILALTTPSLTIDACPWHIWAQGGIILPLSTLNDLHTLAAGRNGEASESDLWAGMLRVCKLTACFGGRLQTGTSVAASRPVNIWMSYTCEDISMYMCVYVCVCVCRTP